MKILFNHPCVWTCSVPGLLSNYSQQTPKKENNWENKSFIINEGINECDIWLVQGDIDSKKTVKTNIGSIFIISEESEHKIWDIDFLEQFDLVLGSQDEVKHRAYIHTQYVCPWQIEKSFDDLVKIELINKSCDISMIASDMTLNTGRKKRFAFANQIKGHFKDKIDWFGRGNLFIENKWDGLEKYKYSIAIENCSSKDYWTEKLADPILAYTIPLYYGCPNVADYIPQNSYINIDIYDLKKSIGIIESAIDNNHYERYINELREARRLMLHEYQFFPKVSKLIDENIHLLPKKVTKKTIYPESYFISKKKYSYTNIVRKVSSIINKTIN